MNETISKHNTLTIIAGMFFGGVVIVAVIFRMAGCCEHNHVDGGGNRYYSEYEARQMFGVRQKAEVSQ